MTLKEIHNAIKNKVEELGFDMIPAFCGETRELIRETCVNSTRKSCAIVSIDGASIGSANAPYRVTDKTVSVLFATLYQTAENGDHLEYIESIFKQLHALRIGTETLQGKDYKLIDHDTVLVFALNFKI